MDGEEPEDPDIRWLWFVAMVAKEFHQLPSVVARDMARDPRRLTVTCFPLLSYGRCKAEYDSYKGDEAKLDHWKGSDTLEAVKTNTFDALVGRKKHREHTEPVEGCRYCKGANRG